MATKVTPRERLELRVSRAAANRINAAAELGLGVAHNRSQDYIDARVREFELRDGAYRDAIAELLNLRIAEMDAETIVAANPCESRNGTYSCSGIKGHDGAHVSRWREPAGRIREAWFADNYSEVTFV